MARVVLDTNALILAAIGGTMTATSKNEILRAAETDELFVSPVSAWEIGLLANLQSGKNLGFSEDPIAFFQSALNRDGWQLLPLSPTAAVNSSRLPGEFHKDPADRLLVASAIEADMTFVTRDAKILAWAAQTKALKVLPC